MSTESRIARKNAKLAQDALRIRTASINNQTTSYTLTLSDAGKVIRMNSSSANNVTVPPSSSVNFPLGTVILIRQVGSGLTSFVAGSGVTINRTSLNMNGQNTDARLHKVGTDEWDLYFAF